MRFTQFTIIVSMSLLVEAALLACSSVEPTPEPQASGEEGLEVADEPTTVRPAKKGCVVPQWCAEQLSDTNTPTKPPLFFCTKENDAGAHVAYSAYANCANWTSTSGPVEAPPADTLSVGATRLP